VIQGDIAGPSRLTYDQIKAVRIPEGPAMSLGSASEEQKASDKRAFQTRISDESWVCSIYL
jgi:hypothetical protein